MSRSDFGKMRQWLMSQDVTAFPSLDLIYPDLSKSGRAVGGSKEFRTYVAFEGSVHFQLRTDGQSYRRITPIEVDGELLPPEQD